MYGHRLTVRVAACDAPGADRRPHPHRPGEGMTEMKHAGAGDNLSHLQIVMPCGETKPSATITGLA